LRKSKAEREESRDISEKIALGLHKGSAKLSGEAMFDSRLFNQSAGISSGFGNDDDYNAFNKPLFDRGEAGSIYRPKKGENDIYGDADAQIAKLSDTSRFKPDKGFKGAEGGVGAGGRDAPVQFERNDDNGDSRSRPRDEDRGSSSSSKRSRFE
jgi:SNW domain-containing protein 1